MGDDHKSRKAREAEESDDDSDDIGEEEDDDVRGRKRKKGKKESKRSMSEAAVGAGDDLLQLKDAVLSDIEDDDELVSLVHMPYNQ
jgi:hypothetical protein